jgi:hypothetical protein
MIKGRAGGFYVQVTGPDGKALGCSSGELTVSEAFAFINRLSPWAASCRHFHWDERGSGIPTRTPAPPVENEFLEGCFPSPSAL